jgi:hypothetical protein
MESFPLFHAVVEPPGRPEMRAAREFGVRLVGQIGGERPLSRALEARTEQGEHVAIVVASDKATDEDRARLIRAAEQMLAAQPPGSLRIRAISPARDAWLTDLWTTGCASDLVALRWPLRRRLDFVRRVVKSLSELHAAGIVHGCLCPANVLLDDDLRPVLSEASAISVLSLTQRKLDTGYAAFAAPEVLLGEAPDVRSDVWSAGRLLESLLIGDEGTLLADCLRLCFAEQRTARWVSAMKLDAALEQVAVRLPSGDTATLPMPSASLAARPRSPSLSGAGERQPSLPLAARSRMPSLPGAGERQPSLPSASDRRASMVDAREVQRRSSSRAGYGIAVVGVTASLGLAAMLGPDAELARRALVALAVLIVAVLALSSAIRKWSAPDDAADHPSRRPRGRK